MVSSVSRFFEEERQLGRRLHVRDVVKRTALACGVSASTVKRCRRRSDGGDYREEDGQASDRPRGRPAIEVDDFTLSAVRGVVHSFFGEKEFPTVDKALHRCRTEIDGFPDMGRSTFACLLKDMGFRYRKREGSTKTLMERPEIVVWRHRFLRKLREHQACGRPVVYLDETWVNANHTLSRAWYDDSDHRGAVAGVPTKPHEAPPGKGKRLIVLHAGWVNGFLPECGLVFVGKKNTQDYHDEMNHDHFSEWWEHQLLPNLPAGAVIVMDNASYHSVKTAESVCPTKSSTKGETRTWLSEQCIPWAEDMLKAELYELVKANKKDPVYVCDQMAQLQGYDVLRLPPYHCTFNPIELIWAWIKTEVGRKNTTFRMSDVKSLTEDALARVTPEQWRKACEHCWQVCNAAWKADGLQDTATDQVIIELGSESGTTDDEEEADEYE